MMGATDFDTASSPRPFRHLLEAIGNTSLVRLRRVVPPGCAQVLVKLEWENPTGSMKNRMAEAVIARAEEVLGALEKGGEAETVAKLADDLPLFRAQRPESHKPSAAVSPLADALASLNPDELSPREALEAIYRLRALLPRQSS